jgi:hypothetical protein
MINTYTHRSILAIAILTASSGVISKEISYDYIEGTYASITDSSVGEDIDGDGLGVGGSFSVAPAIALTAEFSATSYDTYRGIDVDTTGFSFGVTAHGSISPGADIYGNFSVLRANTEATDGFNTIEDDDTGNQITVGLRFSASDVVELEVAGIRTDVFDDTSNSFAFGARFYASEKFSLGIAYRTGDDVDALLFNARFDIK